MRDPDGIVSLDPKNAEHLEAAAVLHANLLPDSPIPNLGPEFMKKFYYRELVRSGLIRCDLYRHGGRYVALSSYTEYPYTFMALGAKKYFFYLVCLLAGACLVSPSRLTVLARVAWQARRRRLADRCGATGEYLSLAVLPEAAGIKDPKTNLRIPQAMLERVISHFRSKRFREILLMIKKSNKKSLFFYQSCGAVPKDSRFVPGDCCLKALPLGSG